MILYGVSISARTKSEIMEHKGMRIAFTYLCFDRQLKDTIKKKSNQQIQATTQKKDPQRFWMIYK